jgi:UDP-GlcNAc:undecaprenyl-phosphate/decaprenyl-phosphate GlcNAc-1-phosphate transferase
MENYVYWIIPILVLVVAVSYWLSITSKKMAIKFDILDNPKSAPNRKNQAESIPLLGGLSFFVITLVSLSLLWLEVKFNFFGFGQMLNSGLFYPFRLIYILIGACIIYVAGVFDDKYQLAPRIYFPTVAVGLAIAIFAGGVKIDSFSYPFNYLPLQDYYLPYILSYCWVGACLVATKFLDGHDGLVVSVGILNLLTIGAVATLPNVNQPFMVMATLLMAASLIGYFPFNFPNAKSYLGEGGSTTIGFFIGILSILAGAKVATVGTTIGWFIVDIICVFTMRFLLTGKVRSILKGDKTHWHHRLVAIGFNKIQVLALTSLLILISSQLGLLSTTVNKIWVIFGQMILFAIAFIFSYTKPQVIETVKKLE